MQEVYSDDADELDKQHLKAFQAGLEQFAASELDAYIDRLTRQSVPKQAKEVNDPVWKTLTIYPLEVVLLDSPLFQRLRRVRQLGVAHLVYPGAIHTRFEHTLGIVHQVQRVISA